MLVGDLWVSILTCAGMAAALTSPCEQARGREYELKAAFLYNFARYVKWPKDRAARKHSLVLGVLGRDPFGPHLDVLEKDRTIKGKKIVVRRFRTMTDYVACQILFVSSSEARRLEAALEQVKGSHVLVVSDTPGFAQRGVTINFIVERRKVGFEVNVDAAKREGLKISSKLLRLAEIVRDHRRSQ